MIRSSAKCQSGLRTVNSWWTSCGSSKGEVRMGSTMASVGELSRTPRSDTALKGTIYRSIEQLYHWLEKNDYRGYDTFDGLNARFVRPLTFETKFLRTVLLQGVRRFPVNLRPLLGIRKSHSTKAMGFLARGFMRMREATGDRAWSDKAEFVLQW